MERITPKEAEQFVPLKNDMKSDLGDAAYFTLTNNIKFRLYFFPIIHSSRII